MSSRGRTIAYSYKDCLQITVDGRSGTKFEMTIIEHCQIINLA